MIDIQIQAANNLAIIFLSVYINGSAIYLLNKRPQDTQEDSLSINYTHANRSLVYFYINKALSLKHLAPTCSHSSSAIHMSLAESNLAITEAPFHTNTSGSNSLGAGTTSTRSIFAFCAIIVERTL